MTGTATTTPTVLANLSTSTGMTGCVSFKNTSGASFVTYSYTVTDQYGTPETVTNSISPGQAILLDLNAIVSSAYPPYADLHFSTYTTSGTCSYAFAQAIVS
jgi:hypothetical protein